MLIWAIWSSKNVIKSQAITIITALWVQWNLMKWGGVSYEIVQLTGELTETLHHVLKFSNCISCCNTTYMSYRELSCHWHVEDNSNHEHKLIHAQNDLDLVQISKNKRPKEGTSLWLPIYFKIVQLKASSNFFLNSIQRPCKYYLLTCLLLEVLLSLTSISLGTS